MDNEELEQDKAKDEALEKGIRAGNRKRDAVRR